MLFREEELVALVMLLAFVKFVVLIDEFVEFEVELVTFVCGYT